MDILGQKDRMSRGFLRGTLAVVCLLAATHFIALFAGRPIFPLLAARMGADEKTIGLLTAVFYVLPLLIAIPAGVFVNRLGPRLLAVGGGICLVCGNALYGLAAGLGTIAAARVLCGLSQITVLLATQSCVAQLGSGGQQDRNFGTMFFFIGVGQFLAPLLGGFVAGAYDICTAFRVAAAVAVLPLILAFRLPGRAQWLAQVTANGGTTGTVPGPAALSGTRSRHQGSGIAGDVGRLLRVPGVRLGVSASAIMLLAEGARESFYPLYAESVGLDEVAIGVLLSLHALFSTLIQPFAGLLAGAVGRTRVLALAMLAGFVGHGTVPMTRSFWPMAGGVAMAGVALGANQPPSMACVADATPPQLRGLAMSVRLAGNRLAMLTSPILAGWAVTVWGLGAYFYGSAGMLACGGVLMSLLSSRAGYRRPGRGHGAGRTAE